MQRDMLRAQQQAYRQQLRGMRRGSILGPLLVIAIGIVFLLVQTGHIPAHDLWLWYGRWWPALLVGAGIVMLLEWAFDQYTARRRDSFAPPQHRRWRLHPSAPPRHRRNLRKRHEGRAFLRQGHEHQPGQSGRVHRRQARERPDPLPGLPRRNQPLDRQSTWRHLRLRHKRRQPDPRRQSTSRSIPAPTPKPTTRPSSSAPS